jgi:hypothetical protein
MDKAVKAISSYLLGKEQTLQEAAATETFLNSLPEDQIARLKSLSTRADDYGPKFRPGEVLGYYDVEGPEGRRQKRAAAEIEMRQAIHSLTVFDPNKKEKLLTLIDNSKPSVVPNLMPNSAPSILPDIRYKFGPTELPVQQQQAYLKLQGHDIGPHGLDGIAGKDSKTQKALEQFAKDHGIDPKDTGKINQHLRIAAQDSQTPEKLRAMQEKIEGGKASPDDIKAVQWLLKGEGAEMPLSLRNGKMDGIAEKETKTLLKHALRDTEFASDIEEPGDDRFLKRYTNIPEGGDPLKLFRENLPELLRPLKVDPKLEVIIEVPDRGTPDFVDVLSKRGVQGIDVSGAFGQATKGQTMEDIMGQKSMVNVDSGGQRKPQAFKLGMDQ